MEIAQAQKDVRETFPPEICEAACRRGVMGHFGSNVHIVFPSTWEKQSLCSEDFLSFP